MAEREDKGLVAAFWESYVHSLPRDVEGLPREYQAWSFGNSPEMADELGKLVLDGTKTATASLAWSYELEAEPYPVLGGYSVILSGGARPMCIIQTTELAVLPFNEVDDDHAYQEGEGDRSLAYWRKVHWKFFTAECEKLGKTPDDGMPIVCEKFKLVYP